MPKNYIFMMAEFCCMYMSLVGLCSPKGDVEVPAPGICEFGIIWP